MDGCQGCISESDAPYGPPTDKVTHSHCKSFLRQPRNAAKLSGSKDAHVASLVGREAMSPTPRGRRSGLLPDARSESRSHASVEASQGSEILSDPWLIGVSPQSLNKPSLRMGVSPVCLTGILVLWPPQLQENLALCSRATSVETLFPNATVF